MDATGPGDARPIRIRRPRVPRVTRVPRRRPPAATRSLLVLGDLLLDVIVRADAPLERGSDVPGEISFRQGGSAANAARAFVRLGGRGALICSVGRDGWGERLVAAMRADGVDVHAVLARAPSGRLVALVDGRGERSFITQRGACDSLRATELRRPWFEGVRGLHIPAYALFQPPIAGAATRAAELAHGAGALVSVDLASAAPLRAFGREAVRAAIGPLAPDVLFANRDEVAVVAGRRSSETMLGIAPLVAIKEGADGCHILWREAAGTEVHRLDVATTPIAAADTTGAGDAFAAGFLHSLQGSGEGPSQGSVERSSQGSSVSVRAATLRRAAMAGHRSALELLRRPRRELTL